jgi:plasmid stabilization system protein ParE
MTRTYRVIVSPEAFRDLDEILDFIGEVSPQAAADSIDRLWAATQSLNRFPNRYPVYQHRRRPELVVRSMPVRPFVIYYRVVEKTRTVSVLIVRHSARRQPTKFPK